MSIWSFDSLKHHLGRKVVPEGSNDFQRVLDEILCSEDIEDKSVEELDADQEKDIKCVQGNYKYTHGDYQQGSDRCEDNGGLASGSLVSQSDNIDNNNNNNNNICPFTCTLDKCQQHCRDPKHNLGCTTSSPIIIKDCLEKSLTFIETDNKEDENFLTLKEAEHQKLNMGTSCSSNFYDHREWHGVKGDNNIDSFKPRKRGRLLKKLSSHDRTSEQTKERKSVCGNGDQVCNEKSETAANVCNCQGQECNSVVPEQPARPLNFQTNDLKSNSQKRVSLSPDDIFDLNNVQLTSNRLSPNVDSSGRVQISRVVGSGRARATADCDVSPHRLLTRRNHSIRSQPTSLDERSADSGCHEERQRSHSWSNGKLGTKANFKINSLAVPPSPANHTKNHKLNSPQILTDRASKAQTTLLSPVPKCPVKVDVHDPECPLHIKPEEVPITSVSKTQVKFQQEDFETDLAPMTRRRAASESQTMRSLKRLPRTPDSSDQIQEHMRVRWADEKKGSSLSTSVFLSSIRPRSHSYGAMDMVPHRPILKKGQAFNF